MMVLCTQAAPILADRFQYHFIASFMHRSGQDSSHYPSFTLSLEPRQDCVNRFARGNGKQAEGKANEGSQLHKENDPVF